jgi:putative endonuclease
MVGTVKRNKDPETGKSRAGRSKRKTRSWYLYVLDCADGTTYTGITTDPLRRVKQHNAGRGARYTAQRRRRPVRLLGVWRYPDRGSATRAELHFKQRRAARKRRLAAQRVTFQDGPFCPEYLG